MVGFIENAWMNMGMAYFVKVLLTCCLLLWPLQMVMVIEMLTAHTHVCRISILLH